MNDLSAVENQINSLFLRDCEWVQVSEAERPNRHAFLPGSFNPLHEAHLKMALIAEEILQTKVLFELSISNVEKPELSKKEVLRRATQNFDPFGLVVSRAATFMEKSNLFPGSTFIVGADTIRRINDASLYQPAHGVGVNATGESAILQVKRNSCSFLVFARRIGKNLFTETNMELSEVLRGMCQFVPPDRFVMDISSTEIRSREKLG